MVRDKIITGTELKTRLSLKSICNFFLVFLSYIFGKLLIFLKNDLLISTTWTLQLTIKNLPCDHRVILLVASLKHIHRHKNKLKNTTYDTSWSSQ